MMFPLILAIFTAQAKAQCLQDADGGLSVAYAICLGGSSMAAKAENATYWCGDNNSGYETGTGTGTGSDYYTTGADYYTTDGPEGLILTGRADSQSRWIIKDFFNTIFKGPATTGSPATTAAPPVGRAATAAAPPVGRAAPLPFTMNRQEDNTCPPASEAQPYGSLTSSADCVLESMGYLGTNGKLRNKAILADLASLNPNILNNLSPATDLKAKWNSCKDSVYGGAYSRDSIAEWINSSCSGVYSKAEVRQINRAADRLAAQECLTQDLSQACTLTIMQEVMAPQP